MNKAKDVERLRNALDRALSKEDWQRVKHLKKALKKLSHGVKKGVQNEES